MNIYVLLFLIGVIFLMVIYFMIKAGINYYVIIVVAFIILGFAAYLSTDSVRPPVQKISDKNQTINGVFYAEGSVISVECDEGFIMRPEKGDCYNESPFGHAKVTLFAHLAGIFIMAGVVQSTFFAWRQYKSPKMKFLIDKYQEENKDIPRNINVGRKEGYVWAWQGFGRYIVTKDDSVFVAKENHLSEIGENLLFKGKRQEITKKALFEYLGKNKEIFHAILGKNASINQQKLRLSPDETDTVHIFIPIPLTREEYRDFYSEKSNYDFGVDRFDRILVELFKMRRAIATLKTSMTSGVINTLGTGVTLTQKSRVILQEVHGGRKENVIKPGSSNPQQPQQDEHAYR